jgi:uncharacterized membrane protein
MSKFTESHARSLVKTIIYRVLVTISMALLVLSVGASAAQTGMIILFVIVVGSAVYYIHERLWLLSFWKRSDHAQDHVPRSIVKTITYRIIIMFVAFFMFKLILGQDNANTLGMTIAQAVINMGWFYIVERLSNFVSWGKTPVKSVITA